MAKLLQPLRYKKWTFDKHRIETMKIYNYFSKIKIFTYDVQQKEKRTAQISPLDLYEREVVLKCSKMKWFVEIELYIEFSNLCLNFESF